MTASSSSSSSASTLARAASTASLTASAALSSSSSSKSNWRGKYLRALNISGHEVDVSCKTPLSASSSGGAPTLQQQHLRRTRSYRVDANRSVTFNRSFHTATERVGDEFQARVNRYQVSHLARTSSRRQMLASSSSSSSNNNNSGATGSGYGFAVKPDLARGRRCHTDPAVSDEKASAPILIPSAALAGASSCGKLSDLVGNNSDRRYDSRSPLKRADSRRSNYRQDAAAGKLLSWEEPSVMMGQQQPVSDGSGGLDRAFSNLQLHRRGSSRVSSGAGGVGIAFVDSGVDDVFCDEFVETDDECEDDEDEDADGASDDDEDDDEIFAMEDFDSDNSRGSSSNNNNNSPESAGKSRGRRRPRTASASMAIAAPFSSDRSAALSRFHSVRTMRCGSSNALELPESFVPPHEMIERDCFSIGLRDEFKRRPAKI